MLSIDGKRSKATLAKMMFKERPSIGSLNAIILLKICNLSTIPVCRLRRIPRSFMFLLFLVKKLDLQFHLSLG